MKILIVDDNPEMREFISLFIRPICQNIYECGDGNEALEFYRKYEPDWVLMDWQMPNVDGLTATRQIIAEYPGANICMVTGFDDGELKKEAIRAGISRFVVKHNLMSLRKVLVS